MKYTFYLLFSFFSLSLYANGDPQYYRDPLEIRLINGTKQYDLVYQQLLREQTNWQQFLANHGTWYVHFNEENALPHRAYGQPIPVTGTSAEEKAMNFVINHLQVFGINPDELSEPVVNTSAKHTWVAYSQIVNGIEVLTSNLTIKLYNNSVIMFGCDVYDEEVLSNELSITENQAIQFASAGIDQEITAVQISSDLHLLPVPGFRSASIKWVYEANVRCVNENNVPSDYYTLIDAQNGQILYRSNKVMHHNCSNEKAAGKKKIKMMGVPAEEEELDVQVTATAEVFPDNPYGTLTTLSLRNLYVNVGGTNYVTDENGFVNIPEDPGVAAQFRLQGEWCRIFTDGVTPGINMILQAGNNDFSFDSFATVRERSAYVSVQSIHDHMKAWMPSFTDMDIQLTTNIDEAGECNAFYDGASINFFNIGGGCNPTSLVADVVYHEYGHGINNTYYNSLGSNFQNGAMNEGYADYWAISLSNNPNLGAGFYTDNEDGIRRYDLEPKRYPEDLVGQVHADGEIICGAWYDTHLLMGADWNTTMPIFLGAYPGLQANTLNGNEGAAFTDVLLDALQADDDDGDISNGTPNGNAIVVGFDMHGITLLGNASLYHNDLEFANDEETIDIDATLDLNFPFTQYLDEVRLVYKINNSTEWTTVEMSNTGGDNYTAAIPAQPKGTVIAYYLGVTDINGLLSNIQPIAANQPSNPNLPYFILVGVEEVGRHDCDDNEDWGSWLTGMGGDNATTGFWELDIPVGSFGTPGDLNTVVQTYNQHTPGGEYCFITGNASNESAPLGENDVDGGKTTLQTSTIEMLEYENPIVAYWRWYTNSPASGANPGADWWQVRLSNNGGSTWTYIENTLTGEIGWRRNAFRVSDYLTVTDDMKMQFIASDSTTIGEYLDGGSLIEAALDDFIIYDEEAGINVSEEDDKIDFEVYPNPAREALNIEINEGVARSFRIYNVLGEVVYTMEQKSAFSRITVPLTGFADGVYTVVIDIHEGQVRKSFTVRN
jgi:Zn-dependent metalloprotease